MLQEVNLRIIYSVDYKQTELSQTGRRILQNKNQPQVFTDYHRFLTGGVEMSGNVFSCYSPWGIPLVLSWWESGK